MRRVGRNVALFAVLAIVAGCRTFSPTPMDDVSFVSPEEPRGNLTGDPWFTDGNRAIMLLSSEPVSVTETEWFKGAEDFEEAAQD